MVIGAIVQTCEQLDPPVRGAPRPPPPPNSTASTSNVPAVRGARTRAQSVQPDPDLREPDPVSCSVDPQTGAYEIVVLRLRVRLGGNRFLRISSGQGARSTAQALGAC